MDLSTFITAVFCLTDDWLKEQRIRRRGPVPKLADSEVLTIEVVGEFLGIETDKGLYDHFRCHYAEWFPTLAKVHRTTFCRQAAQPVDREASIVAAPTRQSMLRPRAILDRQLPYTNLPLCPSLPL